MLRIILFLVLIALAAWGAAWIADQPGEVARRPVDGVGALDPLGARDMRKQRARRHELQEAAAVGSDVMRRHAVPPGLAILFLGTLVQRPPARL